MYTKVTPKTDTQFVVETSFFLEQLSYLETVVIYELAGLEDSFELQKVL
jgi:hypothetical protein